MGIIKYVADPETELQSITYWQLGSLTKVLPKDLFTVGPVIVAASVIIFSSDGGLIFFHWETEKQRHWAFQLQLFETLL